MFQVVDHAMKRMERLHTAMESGLETADMTDVAMMSLIAPLILTASHLLAGLPLSFISGLLAVSAPIFMMNYMEHQHEQHVKK